MLNLDPIVRLRHCTGGIQSSSMGLRFYGGMLEGDLTRTQAGDVARNRKQHVLHQGWCFLPARIRKKNPPTNMTTLPVTVFGLEDYFHLKIAYVLTFYSLFFIDLGAGMVADLVSFGTVAGSFLLFLLFVSALFHSTATPRVDSGELRMDGMDLTKNG